MLLISYETPLLMASSLLSSVRLIVPVWSLRENLLVIHEGSVSLGGYGFKLYS